MLILNIEGKICTILCEAWFSSFRSCLEWVESSHVATLLHSSWRNHTPSGVFILNSHHKHFFFNLFYHSYTPLSFVLLILVFLLILQFGFHHVIVFTFMSFNFRTRHHCHHIMWFSIFPLEVNFHTYLTWCECNSKNTWFFDILRNNLSWSWIGTLVRIGSRFYFKNSPRLCIEPKLTWKSMYCQIESQTQELKK